MAMLWEGRENQGLDRAAEMLNRSIGVDKRMVREDLLGSIAHAKMLAKQGIISVAEGELIARTLEEMLSEIEAGTLPIDESCEDIHTFAEAELTKRIGDTGKKVHTARSRNDQVANDLRLYVKGEIGVLSELLRDAALALTEAAEREKDTILPGYTHLQRAQPILFGHHLMAYVQMFLRDLSRLSDCLKRTDVSVIGSAALAGTTYDTDRAYEAELLGFSAVSKNSLDSVSDRDFAVELLADLSILAMHISRLSEELVLWSSKEFGYIRLSSAFTTGSSIMPQKRNPDLAELLRGKTGRVYGDLVTLLTVLKGLPMAYNKDMQEDKEPLFDACDTVRACLTVLAPMIRTMQTDRARMLAACREGFINATDLADYLTRKGMPFRDAYKLTGQIVDLCERKGVTLEELPLEEYRALCPLFSEDLYPAIDMETCVALRTSFGGTSKASVEKQIEEALKALK